MNRTLGYYERNAYAYFLATSGVDMSAIRARFAACLPPGARVLDAGCGSGRDALAFSELEFRVEAFDACFALVAQAREHTGLDVVHATFANFAPEGRFDGIWACASLLHVSPAELDGVLARLWGMLAPAGVMYVSFKRGEGVREVDGRLFVDQTASSLAELARGLDGVQDVEVWESADARSDRADAWVNALIFRSHASHGSVICGGAESPFLPHLCEAIRAFREVAMAVSFARLSGVRLLMPDLLDCVASAWAGAVGGLGVRLRILTSDYLGISDPEALRLFLLLGEQGAEVRVFETASQPFHLKAYLFARRGPTGAVHAARAFVGSSNLSRQALTDALEWNWRADWPSDAGALAAWESFEALWEHRAAVPLTHAWVEGYEARRVIPSYVRASVAGDDATPEEVVEPNAAQSAALEALRRTREAGWRRGLVVLATGLGKTWLAALDARAMRARRVLFVAHREEILRQAATTFLRIWPQARVGFWQAGQRDRDVDVLCASIQSFGREGAFDHFSREHFDYVVVDEFHHASAPSYQSLLAWFSPRFLLGLTATPDRTDRSDILSLCDNNLVHVVGLFEGISAGLLVPFRYFGILDESVPYVDIWLKDKGRFDREALDRQLATEARAAHVLAHWREKASRRTLAFCTSVRHARFMSEYFRQAGVACEAVYAGSPVSRVMAIDGLRRGEVGVVFSVDLFSEGVDVPEVDTVMMLRPTESRVVFLQQMGRGLRRSEGKKDLVVLDFVGNHQSFTHKLSALVDVPDSPGSMAGYVARHRAQAFELPPGCFVNFAPELLDFWAALERGRTGSKAMRAFKELWEREGRRPTLAGFYRSGASLDALRRDYATWWDLLEAAESLTVDQARVAGRYSQFLYALQRSERMNKSFKMVLLEAFQELDGWRHAPQLDDLFVRCFDVMSRRREFRGDLEAKVLRCTDGRARVWQQYWRKNPVHHLLDGPWFELRDERFCPAFSVAPQDAAVFAELVAEILEYRLASYADREGARARQSAVVED